MSKRPNVRGPLWFALAMLLAVPLTGAIDEQEFACEEALKHVQDCCPAAPKRFSCGATCEDLDTSLATADCLRRSSCDELKATGACEEPLAAVCK